MTTAFDVRALGSVVRVELDDSVPDSHRDRIRDQWIDLIEDGSEPVDTILGTLDHPAPRTGSSARVVSASSPERLAAQMATEVTLAGIAKMGGSAVMLHAGAVALDDGRVIAFVGPSGRGKTTATQVLGRTLGYVTDETLAVLPDGEIVSYRKPLSIGRHPEAKTPVAASGMGLRDLPSTRLQLEAIVVLDRRAHVDAPYVEELPLLEALNEIVPQTSFLSSLDSPLRTLLSVILSTGGVRRVVYSEAETLPGLIEDILSSSSAEDPQLITVAVSTYDCGCGSNPDSSDPGDAQRGSEPGPTYRRADYRDALSVDDALVVLHRNTVTVLEGIGPVLWFAAEDVTEAELTDAALRELPEPPAHVDPAQVVATAVRELIDANLLARA